MHVEEACKMTEDQYYEHLNKHFYRKNVDEFNKCNDLASRLLVSVPCTQRYERLGVLLKNIEDKYGFGMRFNYTPLYLWQKCFCPTINDDSLFAAGTFVVFCCLVDNFLDSNRYTETEKDSVAEKIRHFVPKVGTNSHDIARYQELDELREIVLNYINGINGDSAYATNSLISDISAALESELFMYESRLKLREAILRKDLKKYIDKSVLFEKAAFLMASSGYNTKRSVDAAESVGRIFWLIDDLCDFVADIKAKRRNSLLVFCVKEEREMLLTERIEIAFRNIDCAINELENELDNLKKSVDVELYSYMMSQVWKWGHYVRIAV